MRNNKERKGGKSAIFFWMKDTKSGQNVYMIYIYMKGYGEYIWKKINTI